MLMYANACDRYTFCYHNVSEENSTQQKYEPNSVKRAWKFAHTNTHTEKHLNAYFKCST